MTHPTKPQPRRALAFALMLLACPLTSLAQEQLPLSEVLPELLGSTIILQPTSLPDQPNHRAHFAPGFDQLEVPGQFNQALLTLLSTSPVASPSGGFTYTFDPVLGTFRRTSDSFGPTFAERALTIGRGRVSVGYVYQHASYDTFEGLNLRQREVKFYVRHQECCSSGGGAQPDGSRTTPAFEGDLIKAELALNLSTDSSVFAINYGLSDRLDISAVVPFVHVKMDASVLATIERLSTAAQPEIHGFEGEDRDHGLFQAGGEASGLGDITLRSKYLLWPAAGGGVAAGLDVRVPTGDESNLLGTGGVQTKLYAIGSFARGPFSPHLNAGYTFSSQGALPRTQLRDEVNVSGGFDLAVTPRATIAVDIIGRSLRGAGRLREAEKTFEYVVGGTGTGGGGSGSGGGGGGGGGGTRPVEQTLTVTHTELKSEGGHLNLAFGSASVRFTPWRSVLITAGLLFPLTEAGLRDRVTPIIGIDYGF